jgi:predicted Zn-dependent peptidase
MKNARFRNPAVKKSELDSPETTLQKTVLPSGLTVITERVPQVRSVSVGLWVNTGSRDETTETSGISHFIEHMIFKGTKRRTFQQINRYMEEVGGYMNAFTSKEQTCFYTRCLDENLDRAIDITTDIVFNSIFPEKEMAKEKDVVIEEMKNTEDTPDDLIFDEFEKKLYLPHPLGMPIIGTEETVRSFSRQDLKSYMKQHYTTGQMLLSCTGNLTHEAVLNLVEKSLAKQSLVSKMPKAKSYEQRLYTPSQNEVAKPIQQAQVVFGFPFVRSDKDYHAMHLLNTALGSGMSSRLNLNIREKHGLAYTVYSFINSSRDTNAFGVYIGTDKEKVTKAITLIKAELQKLAAKPLSTKELDLAKSQLKGSVIIGLESMSNRMMRIGKNQFYFGRNVTSDEFITSINAVTPAEIQNLAGRLFDEKTYTTLIFRPKK